MSLKTTSFCAICKTRASISLCIGCKRDLCAHCFNQHRYELSLELDELVNRRNELIQSMKTYLSGGQTDKSSCLNDITRWQQEMHANIDRIATRARENAQRLLTESGQAAQYDLNEISKDLEQRQQSGGYVETDLNEIRQQLDSLSKTIKNSNEKIYIDTNTSKTIPWDSLITVVSKKKSASPPPPPYSSLKNSYQPSQSMPQQVNRSVTAYAPPQRDQTIPATPKTRSTRDHTDRNYSQNTNGYPTQPYSLDSQAYRQASSLTFTCVGCKTVNNRNPSGQSFCSNCKSPAWF